MATTDSIPFGLCGCGCGQPTTIAKQSNTKNGWIRGQPIRFVSGHNAKLRPAITWYQSRGTYKAGAVDVHRLGAEKALGHPLPPGAEVHHVNEDKQDSTPGNLVICQDHAYHALLHCRARVVRAGGDPNTQKLCLRCGQLKSFDEFARNRGQRAYGRFAWCRPCAAAHKKETT